MASVRGIAVALATLAEAFPTRSVTARTSDVWAKVLEHVTDEQLARAVLKLCRDPQRKFFPSSGEVFAAIAEDAEPVDVLQVIHRIEKLGYYDPKKGWVYPDERRIREALGDAVADAYALAGREKIFASEENNGSTITRDIARRKLSDKLDEEQRARPAVPILPAFPWREEMLKVEPPRERKPLLLNAGQKTPLAGTVAKVTAEIKSEESAA